MCPDAGLCSTANKRYCSKAFKGSIATQPVSRRKVPESVRDWALKEKFRTGKTHFGMSNVYLHTEKHIAGHFELIALATNMLVSLVYKVYSRVGREGDRLGRLEGPTMDLTLDRVLDELSSMRSALAKDDEGNMCMVTLRNKNEINKTMADTFGFSLTTQVRPLSDIKALLS